MRTEQKVFNNLIETIVRNSENNIATIADVKLWAETWQKEMELELTLTDASSMFSKEQMEKAYNDGVEAEQQRCCEFNIENYC
jgi:hypothetical protein